MPRCKKGEKKINFIHIIDSLKRKPGAFEDYKYKDCMYPATVFRKSYDMLKKHVTEKEAKLPPPFLYEPSYYPIFIYVSNF